MKKLIPIVLVAFILSTVSLTAFAKIPDTAKYDGNGAIREDLETIATLRKENTELSKNIKKTAQENKKIAQDISTKLKAARSAMKDENSPLREEIKTLSSQKKSLKEQIEAAESKDDSATAESLKAQLADVNAIIKADLEKIKSNNQSDPALAALKEKILALKDQTKAIREQIKTNAGELKTPRENVKEDTAAFKTAIENKDYTAADNALKTVVLNMQKINTGLSTSLSLKQQMTTLLNNFLATA